MISMILNGILFWGLYKLVKLVDQKYQTINEQNNIIQKLKGGNEL